MTKIQTFLQRFLEYFPYGMHFTPEQNREIASLMAFCDRPPLEQINKLALDLGVQVIYNGDGTLTIGNK